MFSYIYIYTHIVDTLAVERNPYTGTLGLKYILYRARGPLGIRVTAVSNHSCPHQKELMLHVEGSQASRAKP